MNIRFHPPMIVPDEFRREMDALPKAALLDVVWTLCEEQMEGSDLQAGPMLEFRKIRDEVLARRK